MAKKKVKKVDNNDEVQEEKLTKAEKKQAKKKKASLYAEFKKFVSRGNVVDMSIGVVIGSAFGAIVTGLTNIFLSVCTWAVPGGLKGLVTVLPAATALQRGWIYEGEVIVGQSFSAADIYDVAGSIMEKIGETEVQDVVDKLTSRYTLHGGTYIYNGAAIIDWGTFLNAILTFIIIALVLFMVLKTFTTLQKYRKLAKDKAIEAYYKKHPNERPEPEDPKKPELTERQLLKEILTVLKNERVDDKKAKKTKLKSNSKKK